MVSFFYRVYLNKFLFRGWWILYRTTSREHFFLTLLHFLAAAGVFRSDLVTVLSKLIPKKNRVVYFLVPLDYFRVTTWIKWVGGSGPTSWWSRPRVGGLGPSVGGLGLRLVV